MDIKKFIQSTIIDSDYNKIIQIEIDEIKHKSLDNNYKCLYNVAECDFFKPIHDISEIVSDPNIIEFLYMCKDEITSDNLIFSGPMIKRILNPSHVSGQTLSQKSDNITNHIPISNYYNITVFGTKIKSNKILKNEYESQLSTKASQHVIKTKTTTFYINKKTYDTLSESILSNQNNLDRIGLHVDRLLVSGMFILEFYKRISCYDQSIMDPVFGYPEDILDIYNKLADELTILATNHNIVLFFLLII